VWSKDELKKLGEWGLKHGILIVSDEIHSDLIFSQYTHMPLAMLSDDIAANTVTCMAPSKTFNLAGMSTSSVIISDEKLREIYKEAVERVHTSANIFGSVASEAAYNGGREWLEQLMAYLQGNLDLVESYLAEHLPQVKGSPLEATYLLWLDFREFNMNNPALKKKLIHEAGVGLIDGRIFGPGGEGFQRMNIACPRATLKKALDNIARAFI
jgi:cystathionine beta-lyase